ncbi:unnamed protein product [Lactuca virosa]|uniref:YqgF/RNase H-like domain-containing protein n=1 Tax=Lactuca virosa TaxID=75947 RepID=A0AAU9M9H8_9ASTR|nr:unnamed protein product [Lactuca virosa]
MKVMKGIRNERIKMAQTHGLPTLFTLSPTNPSNIRLNSHSNSVRVRTSKIRADVSLEVEEHPFPFPPNAMRRKLDSRWLGRFSLGIDLGLSRTGLAISKGFSVRPLKVFDLDFIMCVSTLGSGIKGPKA